MSKRNNLFNFATSELSQDAFLGWLLSFEMRRWRSAHERF